MAALTRPVHRLDDYSSGHDLCPPRPLITASEDVFVNSKGCSRLNDIYYTHWCGQHAPHNDYIAEASHTVFVNSRPIGRLYDPLWMYGYAAEASDDVFSGD